MQEPFTLEERAAVEQLREPTRTKILNAATRKERRSLVEADLKMLEARIHGLRTDVKNVEFRRGVLDRRILAWEEIEKLAKDARLQGLQESGLHKLLDALSAGAVILPVDDKEALAPENKVWFGNADIQVFVVQHDWASALKGAEDFSTGEFRLPYTDQAFEFRISGRRVIALAGTEDGICKGAAFYIETAVGWALAGYTYDNWLPHEYDHEIAAPILNIVRDQVRAVAISLEAEIAATNVIRAPHRLNKKRVAAGKSALYDFHIVSLANRKSTEALEGNDGARKRLHFVRGHWRHFEVHKTWIKWHLRGDPNLGFIDKQYRL